MDGEVKRPCKACGKPGHQAKTCGRTGPGPKNTCSNCGRTGHIRPTCTFESDPKYVPVYRRPVRNKPIRCRNCGHPEHVSDQCTETNVEVIQARRRELREEMRVFMVSARQRARDFVNEHKKAPCVDCGRSFPTVCMDLDHRPDSGKVTEVSNLVRSGRNLKTIAAEIAKCDLVCSNCHRIRTYKRWYGVDPEVKW